jgi:hypothetical protein
MVIGGIMRYAIVGSRTFNDYNKLKDTLNLLKDLDVIISGGAKGADSLAQQYAIAFGIQLIEYLPDWKKYGRAAGHIRNKDIVDNCDKLIAFWDGKSKGTLNSIKLAQKSNKLFNIIMEENIC